MPSSQRMIEAANALWRRENIDNIPEEWFTSDRAMAGVLSEQIVRGEEFDQVVVNSFPLGMMEMLRSLFLYNLRGPRVGIQFLWLPGYDWEMTVTEAPDTPDSPSAISVLIRGRYGRDPHPSTIS